jgi:energy-coupling factor transporter ATP-binding protein EcfA2
VALFIARLNREGHTVLLTTHYLEEAEALCGRIAMLKQGRVVALDKTSAAAGGQAPAPCCASRPTMRCRPRWRPQARVTGRIVQAKARDAADVETMLAALRAAGCEGGRPGDRPRRPGGRVPGNHAGAADRGVRHEPLVLQRVLWAMHAGAGTLYRKEVLRFWKVAFQTVAAPGAHGRSCTC